MLEEFDLEIKDKKGSDNVIANHLSRIEKVGEEKRGTEVEEKFPDEQLFQVKIQLRWYANLVNYLAYGIMPQEFTYQQKKKLRHEARFYIDPLLFRRGADQIVRRCVPETEQAEILDKCHLAQYGGHFVGQRKTQKILQSGFYWPTLFKDSFEWVG